MERPGKRVQEIPEDPEEQLKLALAQKIDKIKINDTIYKFKFDAFLNPLLRIYVNKELIGIYHINEGILSPIDHLNHLKRKIVQAVDQLFITRIYDIAIDPTEQTVIIRFHNERERILFSNSHPEFSFSYDQVFISDRNLVLKLKTTVKTYFEPFLTLVKLLNPNLGNIEFHVNQNLMLVTPDGQSLYDMTFKKFPSLNKLAWKKLTPEKQREFNIYAPNECRICQNPTEVMCSLTRIPFCSKECQMKYF